VAIRPQCVLLLGASGLVGRLVLDGLLVATGWQVLAPARRTLQRTHPRLRTVTGEPATADGRAALREAMHAGGGLAALVCCLGSTARAAGSAEAFAAIDRDLVVQLAADARGAGARQAIVVSSVGASAAARNMYLRVKGEMEAGVAALGFRRCDFLRPGLLRGERQVRRPLEAIGQRVLPLLDPLLPGRFQRYRSIDAAVVAAAALALLDAAGPGIRVHDYAGLQHLATRSPAGC
jgi:uncharacterized protein YbjT (DUF2867 family)